MAFLGQISKLTLVFITTFISVFVFCLLAFLLNSDSLWLYVFVLFLGYLCFIILLHPAVGFFIALHFVPLSYLRLLIYEDFRLGKVQGIPLSFFFLILIFIGFFLKKLINKKIVAQLDLTYQFFLFPLIILGILSTLWSENLTMARQSNIELTIAFLWIFLAPRIINNLQLLKRCLIFSFFLGLIVAIIDITSIYVRSFINRWDITQNIKLVFMFTGMDQGVRASGLVHPNWVASILNLYIALSCGLFFLLKKKLCKTLIFLGIMFMIFAHLTTKSRGGLIGLLAGTLCLFYFVPFTKKRPLITSLVSLFILALFFHISQIITKAYDLSRLATSAEMGAQLAAGMRFTWWQEALSACFESYGLGVGIGSSPEYLSREAAHPHNLYIHLLLEIGVIGLLLFLLILHTLVIKLKKLYESFAVEVEPQNYLKYLIISYSAGLVAILIHGLVDIHFTNEPLWFYLGIGFALVNLSAKYTGKSN